MKLILIKTIYLFNVPRLNVKTATLHIHTSTVIAFPFSARTNPIFLLKITSTLIILYWHNLKFFFLFYNIPPPKKNGPP